MAPKKLRRENTAGLPEDFELCERSYGVGVSWDVLPGKPHIDIDLQCVVVDTNGVIFDCAYYNNLKVLGAITHSGDEPTGAAKGIDELVWVDLEKLPDKVGMLVFVIAAHSGGLLKDVANGVIHVMANSKTNEIARAAMEESATGVDVVAVVFRGDSGWNLRIIEEPGQEGQHFMDILPLLANVIRGFIPSAPKRQKVAFAIEKGGVMDFPKTQDSITIGLGWDVDRDNVDLDVSAVLLDEYACVEETVFFNHLESTKHGIKHSGDNRTGEGDGDDEQIVVKLGSVGPEVQQVVFVINIYSSGVNFLKVRNPYCRVTDDASEMELCRYQLREAGDQSGLIVAKIAREPGDRWGFHALGQPCRGRTFQDSLGEIKALCQKDCPQASAEPVNSTASTSSKWICPKCDAPNRMERLHCNDCGAARPPSAAAAGGGGYAAAPTSTATPATHGYSNEPQSNAPAAGVGSVRAMPSTASLSSDKASAIVDRLQQRKSAAVADEDYELAARLKTQMAEAQALVDSITELEVQKQTAVAEEDYAAAAAAKRGIEEASLELSKFDVG